MNIVLEPDASALLAALHRAGFAAYVVGGCVRDSLLGLAPVSYTHLDGPNHKRRGLVCGVSGPGIAFGRSATGDCCFWRRQWR